MTTIYKVFDGNVANVLLTADHGFLYNDMKFEEKDKHSIKESAIEKKTRYYLTDSNDGFEDIVKFPLDKVSSIKSTTPLQVAVPIGTNRLAAPGGYNFAHGGASLQEMIIPVIRSQQKRTNKTEKVGVALMSHNLNIVKSIEVPDDTVGSCKHDRDGAQGGLLYL